jgi:hypothetical protein
VIELHELAEQGADVAPERGARRGDGGAHASSER